ncbi:dipeptide ABC transporter ATP-binding protein [Cellulomonas denverensis]|uniref:ABC transporter ATP-binding protein n=1 Tax=Cellulomonas denverensis TaxID=264297 RepID=A0A7X6QZM1_9CELL|nr:ABC transporter ATP-binding protein [Cellulomonas denverensis]NKY23231.1 ABC transporter ATP-binding protein [Cellulomonas denverensis]GIG26349.1 ABC transporter ATP-binding protein [Cellulomonas denverensis]
MPTTTTSSATLARPVLRVRGLDIAFAAAGRPPVPVATGVDLDVRPGELVALLGESGSGKTVTARAIMGVQDPAASVTATELSLGGTDLLTLTPEERRRLRGERMSMVLQDALSSLNPVLSVGDQLGEILRVHRGASRRAARDRAVELLDQVGIVDPAARVDDYPHQFSGGMRQRILIAMAIALEPELLIADEPTTALDVTVQAQILRLLDDLRRRLDMAVLLITHDIGVVTEVADRLAVMHQGRVVEQGDADAVFAAPRADYTRTLLASAPHPAPPRLWTPPAADAPGATGARSVTLPVAGTRPEIVLEATDVVRVFRSGSALGRRSVRAVDGVGLQLRRGETLAVVGESGSGKSTLARVLVGLESADSGTVVFRGQDVTRRTGSRRRRPHSGIQMVFQDPYTSLDPRMRVRDVVAEPLTVTRTGTRDDRYARAGDLLELVGLGREALDRFPHQFSGGQRQRIGIARALMRDPDVLVCDEPVSALDVTIQAQVVDLLVDLQDRLGVAIVFISHDLSVVQNLAHRVLVMRRGEVVETGDVGPIFSAPQHPYTRELLASIPPLTRAERGRITGVRSAVA